VREEKVRKIVRKGYADAAMNPPCCAPQASERIGYTQKELDSVPEGANLGLGCGNPVAIASLKEGETVVDLGSGGGFDCFLAAEKVGEKGKVVGVDMTPEMIDRARRNLTKSRHKNVEFRLGEIENLPVADNTADVIISNCVINLSPNKKRVFEEAFRVLKPGGRLMISDIVLLKELPEKIKNSAKAYISCVAGAMMKNEYIALIEKIGFEKVKIVEEMHFGLEDFEDDPAAKAITKESKMTAEEVEGFLAKTASIRVSGIKPN
jgi:arsenite methyltransferase